jgi:glycerol-3-phosphate cytidylyltransferase
MMQSGFICGVFDFFHYGHILALRECKSVCNHLTVAVNSAQNIDQKINPNKQKPVFSLEERMEILKECKLVDKVVAYHSEEELQELLKQGNYEVRFLGDDYKDRPITGREYTKHVHFLDRSHGLSSSLYKHKLIQHLTHGSE